MLSALDCTIARFVTAPNSVSRSTPTCLGGSLSGGLDVRSAPCRLLVYISTLQQVDLSLKMGFLFFSLLHFAVVVPNEADLGVVGVI